MGEYADSGNFSPALTQAILPFLLFVNRDFVTCGNIQTQPVNDDPVDSYGNS